MNTNLDKQLFHSSTYGVLTMEDVIVKIKEFLDESSQDEYSLAIGTDSHERNNSNIELTKKNGKEINVVTAILIHRKGFGGKYFWQRQTVKSIHTLRDKIYSETMASLNFASIFVPLFKKELNGKEPNYNLEIHVDVGEHGDTRDMIKEVVGMVTGYGYTAKTKPDAYGASYVADKHT